MSRPKVGKTRQQIGSKLGELVGPGKEFMPSEVPTLRACIQRGILIKERQLLEDSKAKTEIHVGETCKELAPLVLSQWQRSNPKFYPPVVIKGDSLVKRLERLWKRANEVARGRAKKAEQEEVAELLDQVLDITKCPHKIFLCHEVESGCKGVKECKVQAHITCDCPLASKVPQMELRWLAAQRAKKGEKSEMMMSTCDKVETKRQQKAAQRKADEEGAKLRKEQKEEEREAMLLELQEASNLEELDVESEEENIEVYKPSAATQKEEKEEVKMLVEELLRQRLGEQANLVVRYLGWPGPKRNTMPILHTARASLRFG